jgi:type II secretion system protein C
MNRTSSINATLTDWLRGEGVRIGVTLLLAVAIVADALSFVRSPPAPQQITATNVPVYRPAPPLASAIAAAHLFGVAAAAAEPLTGASAALKLTGTIVWEDDASRAYAILGPSEQQTKTFSPGMSVDNGAQLDRVYRDHVRLTLNGGYITVTLPHAALHGLFAGNARSLTNGARTDVNSIERTWLDDLVAQPSYDDQHFQGFVLSPTKQIRQRFGLREGDVVTEINGIALDRPTSAEPVLQKLGSKIVLMTIIRDGSSQLVSMDLGGS